MNEQIKEWTEESGLAFLNGDNWMLQDELKYFAKLVAQHEREACANIVEINANACRSDNVAQMILYSNAVAIRARGEE